MKLVNRFLLYSNIKRFVYVYPSVFRSMTTEAEIHAAAVPAKRKKNFERQRNTKHLEKKRFKAQQTGSIDYIVGLEVDEFRKKYNIENELPKYERFEEVVVEIKDLLASGDGIGYTQDKTTIAIVHFALPGDKIKARIYQVHNSSHITCEPVSIEEKSGSRRDDLVKCKYFGVCSGCQLQMMSMEDQLVHKRNVVRRAYDRLIFENGKLPEIGETIPSPIQYTYRTKLTPHFDLPKSGLKEGAQLNIGFNEKGRNRIVDIEECPIATQIINETLPIERLRIKDNIASYKRGATLVFRDSLVPAAFEDGSITEKMCVTDNRKYVYEKVENYKFKFLAGDFFQNNNAILPALIGHVKSLLVQSARNPLYLVDAYCGSGLFSICLSSLFKSVSGIEISQNAIDAAKENASLNELSNTDFVSGSAEKIFENIKYPPAETAVIIDPPRKGCDNVFLDQLMESGIATIVYVSCNVHTQARDIKYLCEKGSYDIQDIRGIDLFPQTVCKLNIYIYIYIVI